MRSLWRGTGKMGGARCPNHAVLKTVVWVTPAPRVRIPPPPLRAAIPPRQRGCGFRRRRPGSIDAGGGSLLRVTAEVDLQVAGSLVRVTARFSLGRRQALGTQE